jgi:hypothetical protein
VRPDDGRRLPALLARAYDALKAVDPGLTMISSVSPRGNDNCRAKDNRSTSPVRFIHDTGVAYRALHRDRPVFDEFGIHIYPRQPIDSIARGYQWPKIGFSNFARRSSRPSGTRSPTPRSLWPGRSREDNRASRRGGASARPPRRTRRTARASSA